MKTAFLVANTSTKRVSELQALSVHSSCMRIWVDGSRVSLLSSQRHKKVRRFGAERSGGVDGTRGTEWCMDWDSVGKLCGEAGEEQQRRAEQGVSDRVTFKARGASKSVERPLEACQD
ncbi:UNVERIFIED_CONTAM: hypothetical protein FKN15_028032 [Acipenser sinensis]